VEITEDISAAISQHEEAVNAVSEALGPYRRDSAAPADDADAEGQLDRAREQYERSSLLLSGLIVQRLIVVPEDAQRDPEVERNIGLFDDDATTRLPILINIDARIAEQAGSLAEAQTRAVGADESYPRPLTPPELADIGPPLAAVCEPIFSELRQPEEPDEPPPTPPKAAGGEDDNPDVKEYFDAILNLAGSDIFGTIASSLSWLNRIGDVLADPTSSFVTWSKDALKQGFSALNKLFSGAWRQVLSKVVVLAGAHVAQVGQLGAGILHHFKELREIAGRPTGWLLGGALRITEVREEAQDLVNQNPDRSGAAIKACQRVKNHHGKRRKPVPWLNKALPMCRAIPAHGVALEAVAAATLVIYSIWLVHDHLDSPVLAGLRLPKNPGMLTNIEAAVR
jgi:hypothetical protein